MTTFRIHFIDGDVVDIDAANPTAARDIARQRKSGGVISKIKVVKAN